MDPSTNSTPTPNQPNQNPAPKPVAQVQPAGLPRAADDRFIPSNLNNSPTPSAPPQPAPPQEEPEPVVAHPDLPISSTPPPQPAQPTPPTPQPPVPPTPTVGQDKPQADAKSKSKKDKDKSNSTQNALQIAEVRDGLVIMNDGSFRSVVMVKSINFDLMSPQEQEAVESSYQAFLNSLYFQVQIFMRSQKVDLRPYLEKLDKIRTEHDNMLLALLMEDYIGYISTLGEQTNIMDKKFYVVIPYFPTVDTQKALDQSKNFLTGLGNIFKPKEQHVTINEKDLEDAKDELRNRVQAVLAGLLQCGVQGIPLDTQELIELYYDTYNPDTATRQQLKDFTGMTADVVTKGEGIAPQEHLQGELK